MAACSTVHSRSARLLRGGQVVEPMRRTPSPTASLLVSSTYAPHNSDHRPGIPEALPE
ncbi:hypothetical protein ACFY3O_35255 [Streptomyces sp. NPDC001046]|uniref:hypothetical protein n=1 Tax=Streptomyces sp. NPDC001046 TaxID=3364543 RepID=UPI00367C2566